MFEIMFEIILKHIVVISTTSLLTLLLTEKITFSDIKEYTLLKFDQICKLTKKPQTYFKPNCDFIKSKFSNFVINCKTQVEDFTEYCQDLDILNKMYLNRLFKKWGYIIRIQVPCKTKKVCMIGEEFESQIDAKIKFYQREILNLGEVEYKFETLDKDRKDHDKIMEKTMNYLEYTDLQYVTESYIKQKLYEFNMNGPFMDYSNENEKNSRKYEKTDFFLGLKNIQPLKAIQIRYSPGITVYM